MTPPSVSPTTPAPQTLEAAKSLLAVWDATKPGVHSLALISAFHALRSALATAPGRLDREAVARVNWPSLEEVAEAINKARYTPDGLPYRTLEDSGRTDVEYCRRLARGVLALAQPSRQSGETGGDDWKDDPAADERWNAGLDFGLTQLCAWLDIDTSDVVWDAATETVDGDVQAVIANILRKKFGDDFDFKTVVPVDAALASPPAQSRETEDDLRRACQPILDAVEQIECICRHSESDVPEKEPVVIFGTKRSRFDICTYGDLTRIAAALRPIKDDAPCLAHAPSAASTKVLSALLERWDRYRASDATPEQAHRFLADVSALTLWDQARLAASPQPGTVAGGVTVLPDGSGCFTASFPLPNDHWLYQADADGFTGPPPMPLRMGTDDPRRQEMNDKARAAARWAIRASTTRGQDNDFDPDAMVQNFVVALLGYHSPDALSSDAWDNPDPVPPLSSLPTAPARGVGGEA